MKIILYIALLVGLMTALPVHAANSSMGNGIETDTTLMSWHGMDSLLTTEVGKDVAEVVLQADSVMGQVIAWNGHSPAHKVLPQWMGMMAKCTLCTPAMYRSDRKVYTRFEAYTTLTFVRGKQTATLQLDYGIGKWVLTDNTGQVVAHHDMPQGELLPMLRMLFPNNELLKKKYDESLQENK